MILRSGDELWWGLTNLLIVAAALVMILLLQRHPKKGSKVRAWQIVFIGFMIAALNGFVFHTFELSSKLTWILWIVQYVVFYIAGDLFHCRVLSLLTNGTHPSPKEQHKIHLITAIMFIVTEIVHIFLTDALFLFLIYAAFLLWPLVYLTFFGKVRSIPMKCLILTLVVSLLLQMTSAVVPVFVAVGHFLDALAMVFGYKAALQDLKREDGGQDQAA